MYVAEFHPEDDGQITILFPDLPGCTSCGNDFDDAYRMALDALGGHIETIIDTGGTPPPPRSLSEIMNAGELPNGATTVFVPVLVDRGSPRRVNISLDPGLLAAIDDAAERRGMTRSAFLASAARREITAL